MPTIAQLPPTNTVNPTDELAIYQSGTTYSVTVQTLLSSTQPLLSVASGTLLGRTASTAGSPQQVSIGTGLALQNGTLVATGAEQGSFPVLSALSLADYAVVNNQGQPALLPLSALQNLFSAGQNISISGGVISASFPLATATTPGGIVPGVGLSIGAGGTLSIADLSQGTVVATESGAQPRSLAARFSDVVNINDFGLARDGVTDDSPKVAKAVAAASARGARLYVPAGGPILLAGAQQIVLQNIALVGDGVADFGYPYGQTGSQFWIRGAFSITTTTDNPAGSTTLSLPSTTGIAVGMLVSSGSSTARPCTVTAVSSTTVTLSAPTVADLPQGSLVWFANPLSPFALGPDVTIEGINFFWPDQVDQPSAPIAYPPLFSAIPGSSTQIVNITLSNVQITNAYDVLTTGQYTTGQWTVLANMAVRGCRICAINTCFTLPNVPDTVYISDTQFSYGVYEAEYLHYFGGGTKAGSNYYLKPYTANNGIWLLVPGDGTATQVSTCQNSGIIGSNNYVFGPRYGIKVEGGTLAILRLTNTGFDQVGTILLCENGGTTWDVQFSDFVAYGMIGTNPTAPTTLFSIQNPPPQNGPNARLTVTGMELGFCCGNIFDIEGQNILDVSITNNKLAYFANTTTPGPYFAARINAPNARLLFAGNTVFPNSSGNIGVQVNGISVAHIASNNFGNLAAAVDVETTSGMVVMAANAAAGTSGASSVIGIGTSNVKDAGNGWDKPNRSYNAVNTNFVANAVNWLQINPGSTGNGVGVVAEGGDANVQLFLGSAGTFPVSILTRQYLEQLRISDVPSVTNFLQASGGNTSTPASLVVGGSAGNVGLNISAAGTATTSLGSTGTTGSPVAFLGAHADRSYSLQAPTSGASIVIQNNVSLLQINPSGALASLTITMPPNPLDGQVVAIASTQTITTLTLNANTGQRLLGAPTTLPANSAVEFRFLAGTWFRKQ